jgi:hypothetical protein
MKWQTRFLWNETVILKLHQILRWVKHSGAFPDASGVWMERNESGMMDFIGKSP